MIRQLAEFQPATWWAHTALGLITWALTLPLVPGGHWGPPAVLALVFLVKEGANFEHHALKGHGKAGWIVDGILDALGPCLVAIWAYTGNPLVLLWMFAAFGIGTMAWPIISRADGTPGG